ncbi:MAG: iron(III) transport system ATP-binding protein [Phenylobacterium sp.]|jgi:iron(III) transport system ATP-binding protein
MLSENAHQSSFESTTPKMVVSNLHYSYQSKDIFDDLSVTVGHDQILCLLGASGCGKTTALKAMAGLLPTQSGEIHISDKLVNGEGVFVPPEERNIGMIFQDYALFPHLTVADNIAFGLKHNKQDAQADKLSKTALTARVNELLDLVKLDNLAERYPHQLSGGQQQRVAIARALAYSPQLLLLDEPFSNIDPQVRHTLIAEIRQILKSQKMSAVFVTHSKEEGFAFADQMAVMNNGRIEQQDTPEVLFNQPKTPFVAEFLGKGVYLPATVLSSTTVQTPLGDIVSTTVIGHPIGSKGELFVRPQYFELSKIIEGEACATIVDKSFIGSGYNYQIAFEPWLIDVFLPDNLLLNSKVRLAVKPHCLHMFLAK